MNREINPDYRDFIDCLNQDFWISMIAGICFGFFGFPGLFKWENLISGEVFL